MVILEIDPLDERLHHVFRNILYLHLGFFICSGSTIAFVGAHTYAKGRLILSQEKRSHFHKKQDTWNKNITYSSILFFSRSPFRHLKLQFGSNFVAGTLGIKYHFFRTTLTLV